MKVRNIKKCSRCGGDHVEVEAEEFTIPVYTDESSATAIAFTHWAKCPNNGEPILIKVIKTIS